MSQDSPFAESLKESGGSLAIVPPALPPDHELKVLEQIKRRLGGPIWLLQAAMIMSALAFARIVSDISFDVSPRKFIITALIAAGFWIAFFVKLGSQPPLFPNQDSLTLIKLWPCANTCPQNL